MKNEKLMCGIRRGVFTRSKTVLLFFIFHFSFFILLAGCKEPEPPTLRDPDPKVFIMYDNIDDDGSRPFTKNVNAAGKAVAAGALKIGHRVIVFHRRAGGNVIYELVRDRSIKEGFRKKELHKYNSGENDDLSKETIAAVVGDIRSLAPANHYGFAFGSHGMGWVPAVNGVGLRRMVAPGTVDPSASSDPLDRLWEIPENPRTRYLAGYGKRINVADFADALDGEPGDRWRWDFILFDDCFMASVEALYEIRNLALFFIASPTEIMMRGFPYDRTITTLFAKWGSTAGYEEIAQGFVNFYLTVPNPDYNDWLEPWATIAVVRGDQLEPLAGRVHDIVRSDRWTEVPLDGNPDPGIQFYDAIDKHPSWSGSHVFFDLDDYLRHGISTNSDEYKEFVKQLRLTVLAARHTPSFFSRWQSNPIEITHFSGLSTFISYSGTTPLHTAYRQTAWYKAVYE